MFTWIKRFLAAPVFEDAGQTRAANLLNIILLTTLVATVAGTAAVIPVEPTEWLFNLVFGIIIVVVILAFRRYQWIEPVEGAAESLLALV